MRLSITLFILLFIISGSLNGQNIPVIIEAESGTLGSDFATTTSGDVTYISPKTNLINSTNPGDASKVASYTVNFADSGTYKLFLRIRVGVNGANDDSFFYGSGFGTKSPNADDDWIICNNLATAGYIILTDVVEEQGDAPSEVWKWACLSDYTGYETPITFRVEQGNLTQTFEIGTREDGFDIDKIAFGRQGVYYTVDNLNNGEAGSLTRPGEDSVGTPLADGLDKFLGCAYGPDSKRDFEGYWNQVTPGNGGKWGWVEGTRDNMVWTDLDEAYKVAMDNNFVYKHHVMVWGSQQPDWVAALDSAEQRAELEEWFAAVAERYPAIDQVEVVNEPLHQPPTAENSGGYIGALGGSGVTGWDWIIESFKMARNVFPDTVMLLINEYNIMNSKENTDEYLKIIKLLQADTLIDGIGFQGHGFSHNATNETILRNIDTLASTGLPIYVTELDIDGLTDLQQVHGYMNLFPLFWEHPSIKGVTLWGFRPGLWRNDAGAFLIDLEGSERPAMLWLRAYLEGNFVPNESITISTSTGETSINAKSGTLQCEATITPDNTTLKKVSWKVNNASIATISEDGLLTALKDGTVTVTATSLELNSNVKDEIEITISGQASGIESISELKDVTIFPNPSGDGLFTISGAQEISQIDVLNVNGEKIYTVVLSSQNSVDIQLDAQAGIYIMRLFDGTNFYHSRVIVK